jgi:glycosyltransferase involved in cell wall biosynthesis
MLQQTYHRLEIIVVDDGSTDETPSVLESYGDRIRWIAQKNAGPSAARNAGLAIAKGEIIAFQDSDDIWHKTKIERQVDLLERAGSSVVCCLCNCVVELSGKVALSFDSAPLDAPVPEGIWLNVAEMLVTRCVLFNQAAAIRRDVLTKIGGFDISFRVLEDFDLALRLSLEGPWAFIREPLAVRRERIENSLSKEATPIVVAENWIRIQESLLRKVESRSHLAPLRNMIIKERDRAGRYLRAAKLESSARFAERAAGWVLRWIERHRQGIYRRMPWFPRMSVSSVGAHREYKSGSASFISSPVIRL